MGREVGPAGGGFSLVCEIRHFFSLFIVVICCWFFILTGWEEMCSAVYVCRRLREIQYITLQ